MAVISSCVPSLRFASREPVLVCAPCAVCRRAPVACMPTCGLWCVVQAAPMCVLGPCECRWSRRLSLKKKPGSYTIVTGAGTPSCWRLASIVAPAELAPCTHTPRAARIAALGRCIARFFENVPEARVHGVHCATGYIALGPPDELVAPAGRLLPHRRRLADVGDPLRRRNPSRGAR